MISIALEEWGLYNAGVLACKWWDANTDIEEIKEFFTNMRKENGITPYDDLELFNADWEGDEFGIISEGTSFEDIAEINEKIESLDSTDLKKVEYMTSQCGYELDEAISKVEDCTIYEGMTMYKLAEEFVEEGIFGTIDEAIQGYLDYDAIARDLSYDYSEYNGDIFRVD